MNTSRPALQPVTASAQRGVGACLVATAQAAGLEWNGAATIPARLRPEKGHVPDSGTRAIWLQLEVSMRHFSRAVVLLVALAAAAFGAQVASAQQWKLQSGAARDVGVGANGAVWIIGTNAVPGGYGIARWSGSSWTTIPGGAERIAVDAQGNAWVVNSLHTVYRFDGSAFQPVAGVTATDIGIGADGTVWVIGSQAVPGGFNILRRSGSTWSVVPGGAVRIAVDPSGKAWVANSANSIFRHDGSNWVQTAGAAKDVGVGADGSVWMVGTNPVPGGYGIGRWNGAGWTGKSGGAVQVSVAPDGNPWVVNGGGEIYQATDSVAATTSATSAATGTSISGDPVPSCTPDMSNPQPAGGGAFVDFGKSPRCWHGQEHLCVEMFEHDDFKGRWFESYSWADLKAGTPAPGRGSREDFPDLKKEMNSVLIDEWTSTGGGGNWNDRISSVTVGSNLVVTFYEHTNYQGKSFAVVGPSRLNRMPSGWNDKVSSVKICPYR